MNVAIFIGVLAVLGVLIFILGGMTLIWKQGKVGKLIAGSSVITFLFTILTAIWPLDSFYIQEFESHTGISLPPSAIVIAKDSSYPDFHGDYFSEAIIRIDEKSFDKLVAKMESNIDNRCIKPQLAYENLAKTVKVLGCIGFSYDELYWMVFSDKRTIFFTYHRT